MLEQKEANNKDENVGAGEGGKVMLITTVTTAFKRGGATGNISTVLPAGAERTPLEMDMRIRGGGDVKAGMIASAADAGNTASANKELFQIQMRFSFPFVRVNNLHTSLLIMRTRSLSYIVFFSI